MYSERLFGRSDLFTALQTHKNLARTQVESISREQFASATDDQIVDHLVSQHAVEPLQLYPDRAEQSITETTVETRDWLRYGLEQGGSIRIPGLQITVKIPFTGDHGLFELAASTMELNRLAGEVDAPEGGSAGCLTLRFQFVHDVNEQTVKQTINSAIKSVVQNSQFQKGEIEQFERELRQTVAEAVARRRERLGGLSNLAKALNIPIAKRPGMPTLEPIPVQRRVVKQLPPVAAANQAAGFAITDEAYTNILRAIRAQGRTFEKTPATYSKFDEEELRDTILGNLNTHFEGGATGETFRARGKTDICIEQDNRAAFVGECKVWAGPEKLVEGLKQLLGYLTWRDCKTALVVFNKDRARFSEIVEKLPATLRQQADLYVSEAKQDQPGEWRMTFKSLEDSGRIVIVQVMLYNLFTSARSSA